MIYYMNVDDYTFDMSGLEFNFFMHLHFLASTLNFNWPNLKSTGQNIIRMNLQ